jgi:hypothetical protein
MGDYWKMCGVIEDQGPNEKPAATRLEIAFIPVVILPVNVVFTDFDQLMGRTTALVSDEIITAHSWQLISPGKRP